jgi:creatinine amidohydrolase/Fe(II)-dependent formamide hydrolase-like protein
MTTSSEELPFVEIEGRSLSYSHAVLIQTTGGWHVELEDVPTDSCPYTEASCEISFASWEGDHYAGTVAASFARDGAGYALLTGIGELRRTVAADVA